MRINRDARGLSHLQVAHEDVRATPRCGEGSACIRIAVDEICGNRVEGDETPIWRDGRVVGVTIPRSATETDRDERGLPCLVHEDVAGAIRIAHDEVCGI